jgi:nucleoside-diphosphate-sugar epimerase
MASGTSGTIGKHLVDVFHFRGDITLGISESLLNGLDSFVHLAGIVGPKLVDMDPKLAYKVNIESLESIAMACIKAKLKNFIYVSTSHVYKTSDELLQENSKLKPESEYARQKLIAEVKLNEYFSNTKCKLVILRLFSTIGDGMPSESLGGLLDRIILGSKEKVYNSLDVRDFMKPATAASAIRQVASHKWNKNYTFNLSTGIGQTVENVSKIYFKNFNYVPNEEIFIRNNSQIPILIGSPKKIYSMLPDLNEIIKPFS